MRTRIEDTGCEGHTATVYVLDQETVDTQDSRVSVPLVARDHGGRGGYCHRPRRKVGYFSLISFIIILFI